MDLATAYKVVVPFGKHAGKTLRDVANADLTYLPWLRDKATSPRLAEAVGVICDANVVEIEQAVAQAEHRRRGW